MNIPFEEIIERLERIERSMLKLTADRHDPPRQISTDRLFTTQQAAAFLHTKVGTLYQWVHKRQIPFFKRGRLYFREQELQQWIQSGRRQTVEEIQAEAIASLSNRTKERV